MNREKLILHVARSNNIDASTEYRLVWCPFVMSGSDEVEYLFAVALGTSVSIACYRNGTKVHVFSQDSSQGRWCCAKLVYACILVSSHVNIPFIEIFIAIFQ